MAKYILLVIGIVDLAAGFIFSGVVFSMWGAMLFAAKWADRRDFRRMLREARESRRTRKLIVLRQRNAALEARLAAMSR